MKNNIKRIKSIPYGRQDINKEDVDSVVAVLNSEFLTQGPVVPRFEKNIAEYCDSKYAVAVNSATSALHIACLALELGAGDILWTSPNTFVATSNAALYCGAEVDFVDIDPSTYNLSVECLAQKLTEAEKTGRLPKIVIPVHHSGQSCEMESIHALSLRYGFRIIEDASHAIGGMYQGMKVGNNSFSDITVFSFHPVKIITTGEGGMALTNSPELAEKMQRFRSHGITSDSEKMFSRTPKEIWNYQQVGLGFNYRMTDIQAALGISQMMRLDEFVVRRHKIAHRYNVELSSLPLSTPVQHPDTYSSYHLYPIRLRYCENGHSQREAYNALRSVGILVNLHYIPVYRQPYYESLGFKMGYCPEAEAYFRQALSIPMYPSMDEETQRQVIVELEKITRL